MLPLSQKIDSYLKSLEPEILFALENITTTRQFKKGDFLLEQGKVCKVGCLMEQGRARKFYYHQEKEFTTELYFEHDIAVSFDSYCLQKPSREYIQALTDVTVSQIDFNAFQKAKVLYPQLVQFDLIIAEHYTLWLENRLFQFHTQSASERYLNLLEKDPHIIQTIPLTYIASYLGISLETLSRIRVKI